MSNVLLELDEPPLFRHGVTASNMPCTDNMISLENLTDASDFLHSFINRQYLTTTVKFYLTCFVK